MWLYGACFGFTHGTPFKKERKKENSTGMNYGLAHFQVGLNLYVILKWTFRELEDHQRPQPSFKGKHLGWEWKSWLALPE
jgi:hypothetical protein